MRASLVVRALGLCLFVGSPALGCFESGPLAVATHPLADDGDTLVDDATTTTPLDDVTVVTTTDATTATDDSDSATLVDDTATTSDSAGDTATTTPDASDTSDTATAPDAVVTACLINEDCAAVPHDDLCAGTIRCIDYGCRPDPATTVHCQEPVGGDPCIDMRCNPASGQCEPVETCACTPDASMGCGQELTWSTNDLGPIDHFSSYACGPAAGPGVERLIAFAPSAGRVRIDLQSAGTAGFHVLAPNGTRCDSSSGCVAGDAKRVYFDASGASYVIAVDHAAANSLVRLSATCGIGAETDCDDGLDDEGDGKADCADSECNGLDGCPFVPNSEVGLCLNGGDDDQDGSTDCGDSDCANDAGCLETCDILPITVGCGFHQGAPTGGGRPNATHYSCSATPAPGREVVYRFKPSFNGTVNVAFSSVDGIAVYLLQDTGRGCTPRDCITWGYSGFSFTAVSGQTYYFSVDAPAGVEGDFDLHVTCEAL